MAVKAVAQIVNYNAVGNSNNTFTVELKIACGEEGQSGVVVGPFNPAAGAVAINTAIRDEVQEYCEQNWEADFGLLDTVLMISGVQIV